MQIPDIVAIVAILLVVGSAVFYIIIKAKKHGKKCIGCPDCKSCKHCEK